MLGFGEAVDGLDHRLGGGQIRDDPIAEDTVGADEGDADPDATDRLQHGRTRTTVGGDELLDRLDDGGRRRDRGRGGGFAHGVEFTVR